ncbi:MAG: DUF4838 domain-containing protein [Planctomycetota bacterium]
MLNRMCKFMVRVFTISLMGLIFSLHAAGADELVLVADGESLAPVVVFKDAPPKTRRAADELSEYIEKIAGVRPEVIEGEPDPVPDSAIWVGYQSVMDELFPDLEFKFEYPEEILIAANEDHLVIAGRDRWDPDNLVIEGGRQTINGKQQEYGTVNAVYTFLQDYLDVRWLWPGETGLDIVEQKNLAFSPFQFRYHPQFRFRGGLFNFSRLGNIASPTYEWVRLQRLQLHSLDMPVGGHAYTDWWERFHEDHPEYFALQPDGTRSGFPAPRTVKICQSNPAVWERWISDVEEKLERDPNQNVFTAAPNDGWHSGWCICEHCRAWDHPDGELRSFRWEGIAQHYVALSERHITYYNHLARLLKERFPDRTMYVRGGAYGHSRPAPIEAVPDENVIVASVANFLLRPDNTDRGSPNDTPHREQFRAWGEVAHHVVWRPNTGSPAGWQQGLPDVPVRQTINDFKFVAENNGLGVAVDSIWEHWSTQGPMYYVMAQLTWDPEQDAEMLLDDYYRRGFGPAADQIRDYWELLEDTREKYAAGSEAYYDIYDSAFFEEAYSLLDQAAENVGNDVIKYKERIAFLRVGLDYTRLMTANRELMAQFRASDEQDMDLAEQITKNWEEIGRISAEYPEAMNWRRLEPRHGRTAGYHPEGSQAGLRLPPVD